MTKRFPEPGGDTWADRMSLTIVPVPEPSSLAALAAGLAGLAGVRPRRRR